MIELMCPVCSIAFWRYPSQLQDDAEVRVCSIRCRNKIGNEARARNQLKTFEVRFWKRVEKTNACWLWLGGQTGGSKMRYGFVCWGRRRMAAHRASYELTRGPVPEGQCVLHSCDNPLCVRPEHLFLGTRTVNNTDKMMKGRHRSLPKESNPGAKLTEAEVIEIRRLHAETSLLQREIAGRFGISQSTVSAIVLERAWRP
jgi:predicted DNA-binding protein (UPF0251 family)